MKVELIYLDEHPHDELLMALEVSLVRADLPVQLFAMSEAVNRRVRANIDCDLPVVIVDNERVIERRFFSDDRAFVQSVIKEIKYGNHERGSQVVVPIDFSEASENAFRYAIGLAKREGLTIRLVHVFYQELGQSLDGVHYFDTEVEEKRRAHWRDVLTDWSSRYQSELDGRTLKSDFFVGKPQEVLENVCRFPSVSLLVMGSTGSGNWSKSWFGSLSVHIVQKASCPVIVVPPKFGFKPITRILIAVDRTGLEEEFLDNLRVLLGAEEAEIKAVHVCQEENNYLKKGEEIIRVNSRARLEEIVLFDKDLVESLNDYALEHQIDLIVVIKKKRSFLMELFHHSVSREMSANSSVPLLVLQDSALRHSEYQFDS